jgi:hypothetical protein
MEGNESSKIPAKLKPLLVSLGAVAAGHMIGYGTAGVVTRALANTRVGAKLQSMPPQARKEFLAKVLAGTTGALGVAHLLREYARDNYVAKESQKTASFSPVDMVHYAYQTALERR